MCSNPNNPIRSDKEGSKKTKIVTEGKKTRGLRRGTIREIKREGDGGPPPSLVSIDFLNPLLEALIDRRWRAGIERHGRRESRGRRIVDRLLDMGIEITQCRRGGVRREGHDIRTEPLRHIGDALGDVDLRANHVLLAGAGPLVDDIEVVHPGQHADRAAGGVHRLLERQLIGRAGIRGPLNRSPRGEGLLLEDRTGCRIGLASDNGVIQLFSVDDNRFLKEEIISADFGQTVGAARQSAGGRRITGGVREIHGRRLRHRKTGREKNCCHGQIRFFVN